MSRRNIPRGPGYFVRGTQGSPIGRSGGEDFVCIWREFLKFGQYCDPGAIPGDPYWERLVALIQKTSVVFLTVSDPAAGGWKRHGYIAAWEVTDVRLTPRGLELRLVRRLGNAQRGSGGAAPAAAVA